MTTSRSIPPFVSPEWLDSRLDDPGLVVLDVRDADAYESGHVPGAVHAPMPHWIAEEGDLLVPLPSEPELRDAVGALGVTAESTAVVVGATTDAYALADSLTVADRLRYAGLSDVAVLDGGVDRWTDDGGRLEGGSVQPTPVEYEGELDEGAFLDKADLSDRLDSVALVDARQPDDYFGASQSPYTERPGHIPGATSLPAPWIWTEAGRLRSEAELAAMVEGVLGTDRSATIVTYCGASPFSIAWRYVMRDLLGYEDVAVYRGAAEEWSGDPEAPMNRYCWE